MVATWILAALASALLSVNGATVPIPDNDPFYKPPSGFASSAPGTIFKTRSVSSGIQGVVATQVLYRTSNTDLTASATVATILVGPKSSPNILVSYQDFEDSANTTCSPSYLFSTGNGGAPFGPTFDGTVSKGLDNGWTIVIPDYEGFKSQFAVGHVEGYAVLDGLRAALKAPASKVNKNAALGGLGYSGGALATSWAAALQADYAPELNVKGWSFGGTPANTTSTLEQVDGTFFAGFGAAGVAAYMSAYPTVAARAKQVLTADGVAALKSATSQCALADLISFGGQSLQTTKYQTLGPRLLYDPIFKAALAKNILGTVKSETPKAPVYMYHSNKDEVIPYVSARYAYKQWCANGASINFTTEAGGSGHAGCLLALGQSGIDWLDLRVKGKSVPKGCSDKTVNIGGLPFKRELGDHAEYLEREDVIDELGVADEKLISTLKAQIAAGGRVDSFWKLAQGGIPAM